MRTVASPIRVQTRLAAHAGDAFVFALLAASLLEISLRVHDWRAAAIAPFAVLWTLPLLLRRRSGLAAGLTVLAAAAASMAVTGGTVASAMWIAMLAAFFVLGLQEEEPVRAAIGATVGALLLFAVAVTDQGLQVALVPTVVFLAIGPFVAGRAVRGRLGRAAELAELAQRLEQMQAEEARIAVAEERARIAAELNEVIARSVGAMTAQAGAARLLLHREPRRAREAIEAVEETGRETLAETRLLLGVLRGDLAPLERAQPPRVAAARVDDVAVDTTAAPNGVVPVGGAT